MTQDLPPTFSGVPTDCFMVVSCCRRFLEGPGTETRTFLREAGRLSQDVVTYRVFWTYMSSGEDIPSVCQEGQARWPFPEMGKPLATVNCNRRLLTESLSWARRSSKTLTSVVPCNLPTTHATVFLESRKPRPREVKHVTQCHIVHDQASGPSLPKALLS